MDLARFRPPAAGERAQLRATLGWSPDKTIVLFVGRLSVEKGAMDLLVAWRDVHRPNALLVLVGPDMPGHPWDVGASGRAYVTQHALGDRVRFEGPTPDTAPFYRAADLFVQPSHFEAFGSSAIEAMASGLPVVSYFLVTGGNALIHEARSPASLAQAITQMLNDAPLRRRLATGALATAQRFELTALLDRFALLVESTVGRS